MSNTSKISLNQITDDAVIQMLKAVVPVLEMEGIDFFIVGAFARDVGLSIKGFNEPPARKTEDIDLAVMVGSNKEYESLKARIANLADFEPDEKEPYRFIFRKAWEVDFLPFGEIANEKDQVELKAKTTFTLDMPGFEEVAPFSQMIKTEEGIQFRVSSLPGVVLLKLLAWQDRPERLKDIYDIDYILKNFFDLHLEEIYTSEEDIPDIYESEIRYFSEMVSARYIGRKMREMLADAPGLLERLTGLLKKESEGMNMARLMSSAENIEDGQRLIEAIYLGMLDKKKEGNNH
jgi:predicted nucleotidyltransferase